MVNFSSNGIQCSKCCFFLLEIATKKKYTNKEKTQENGEKKRVEKRVISFQGFLEFVQKWMRFVSPEFTLLALKRVVKNI